jgi:predicted nucleotidyltransferase
MSINISNVLFSKTQRQVLGLLYGQPERDFYTNEIIRFCDTGTGAVQRELLKLSSAGIITVTQMGNQKRYQANTTIPVFSELRGIILKTFGLADVLKAMLNPVHSKIDVAFIYGSIAKQQDTATSDIDIMLITNVLTYTDFFKLSAKTEIKLNRKINPTFHTRQEWTKKVNEENHFVSQVLKQPKIFLIGTLDELKAIGKSGEDRQHKA